MKTYQIAVAPMCRIKLGTVEAKTEEEASKLASKKFRGLFLGVRELLPTESVCPDCSGSGMKDKFKCNRCEGGGVI